MEAESPLNPNVSFDEFNTIPDPKLNPVVPYSSIHDTSDGPEVQVKLTESSLTKILDSNEGGGQEIKLYSSAPMSTDAEPAKGRESPSISIVIPKVLFPALSANVPTK